MTTQTTNGATGEQLLRKRFADWEFGSEWHAALDEALAVAEAKGRREACYRILRALNESDYVAQRWVYDLIEREAAR